MPLSISLTIWIRLLCFSKSENLVLIKVSTILTASSNDVFSPKATQFVSLSSLVYKASSLFDTLAQYTPLILLQAILMPIPLPQIAMPNETEPSLINLPSLYA